VVTVQFIQRLKLFLNLFGAYNACHDSVVVACKGTKKRQELWNTNGARLIEQLNEHEIKRMERNSAKKKENFSIFGHSHM